MKERTLRCRLVIVGFKFVANEASVYTYTTSFQRNYIGWGPRRRGFCFKHRLLYVLTFFVIICRLLSVGCRFKFSVIQYLSVVVFCCWLSGYWLSSADCWLSGVAVSGCCWFLVGVVSWLSVNCKDTIPKIRNKYPRKEIARPQSQFSHLCVCERFIYSHVRSAYSAAGKYCGHILGIYKLLTDTWSWKLVLRPRNSLSGNT